MNKLKFCFILSVVVNVQLLEAQVLQLTLKDAISLAKENAIQAAVAKNQIESVQWQYQLFLTDLKPKLTFSASPLPFFDRSIDVITLPDGRDAFVQRSLMRNALNIELQQYVNWTGGTVYANSGLQRIDIFGSSKQSSYFSVPISFGFVQPLFRFDPIAWNKKRFPLILQESERKYAEELEVVTLETVKAFFEVYVAQLNVEAAIQNQAITDTLYQIATRRFDVGTFPKTDLLQLELKSQNTRVAATEARINLRAALQMLSNLTGQSQIGKLSAPLEIPDLDINVEKALELATQNRSYTIFSERALVEAEQENDRAKKSNGLSVALTGSFGLSQTGSNLEEAYSNFLDQEQINLSLQVPIADWGKAKANKALAAANYELVKTQQVQIRIQAEREIIVQVEQLALLKEKVNLAKRALEIANMRSEITRQRYAIGTETIVELNLALESAESARLQYITAIQAFWIGYYTLRNLTLYDFETNQSLR